MLKKGLGRSLISLTSTHHLSLSSSSALFFILLRPRPRPSFAPLSSLSLLAALTHTLLSFPRSNLFPSWIWQHSNSWTLLALDVCPPFILCPFFFIIPRWTQPSERLCRITSCRIYLLRNGWCSKKTTTYSTLPSRTHPDSRNHGHGTQLRVRGRL
jgi:hypothetical protein